jgi:hypothetical protein
MVKPAKNGRNGKPAKKRANPVTVTEVYPAAWRIALDAAGNDANRLKVVDANTVLVMNRPRARS